MTLAGTGEIIAPARRSGSGVGAFNVIQLEHAEAIVAGAEAVGAPVILQISENAVRYHGGLAPIGTATLAVARARPCRWPSTSTTRPSGRWWRRRSGWASAR